MGGLSLLLLLNNSLGTLFSELPLPLGIRTKTLKSLEIEPLLLGLVLRTEESFISPLIHTPTFKAKETPTSSKILLTKIELTNGLSFTSVTVDNRERPMLELSTVTVMRTKLLGMESTITFPQDSTSQLVRTDSPIKILSTARLLMLELILVMELSELDQISLNPTIDSDSLLELIL